MKKPVLLLIFSLLLSGALKAQPIDWDAVMDRYVEKYQPEIMPEWLFPIIFENGVGARDTIYIGKHPDAHFFGGFPADTVFGERWFPADTSLFQARFFNQCMGDSICELLKTDVSPDYEALHPISFFHGTLPVRMYFNTALFRSDVLPQYNPPELPQLQGEVWEHSIGIRLGSWNDTLEEWEEFCVFDAPVLLSDTADFDEYCAYSDSVYIGDIPDNFDFTKVYNLDLYLRPWAGHWVAVKTPRIGELKLFPNPATDKLYVDFENVSTGAWKVHNLSGKQVRTGAFRSVDVLDIPVNDLENGMYFLLIQRENNLFAEKFVVLH